MTKTRTAIQRVRRAFSIVELIVAVAVLVLIMVAVGRIFGTTRQVTSVGLATSDILLEVAALERQLREDFAKISNEGFFAIRQHAIRNNIRLGTGAGLLNPSLPPEALIRADQLVFFTKGAETMQTIAVGAGSSVAGQSNESRVYFGHGFQLPDALPYDQGDGGAHDLNPDIDNVMTPWGRRDDPTDLSLVPMVRTDFSINANGETSFNQTSASVNFIDGTQPEARQWLLCRQAIVLADDDFAGELNSAKTVFGFNYNTSDSAFLRRLSVSAYNLTTTPEVRNGRVDAAATRLNEIRRWVTQDDSAPWSTQYANIASLIYHPRAERQAPGSHRVDQTLTSHVIASACSSVRIEWTWNAGVGYDFSPIYTANGVYIDTSQQQPWFGGDFSFEDYEESLDSADRVDAIFPGNIESFVDTDNDDWTVYQAIFGYNQDIALNPNPNSSLFGRPDPALGYTPWPTAIRITLTLHDPDTAIEAGREFQFVIPLPSRDR